MTDHGTDIEFDFFDEPETQEAPDRPWTTRSGPRGPRRPSAGLTPILRLAGLVAFGIVILFLIGFWIQSCRAESKRDTYESYMDDVRVPARSSEAIGRELAELLTTPGVRQAALLQRLQALASQQRQVVTQARELTPPGPLRPEHLNAVDSLQLRENGLIRLRDAFAQTAQSKNAAQAGQVLAQQAQRFVASDIVWDDLFRSPSVVELRAQGIGGVIVPDSNFLTNQNLATQAGMRSIWQRIHAAATGGTPSGRHGNGIVQVRALPDGPVLRTDTDNIVVSTPDLGFAVTIENSGEFQEVRVRVRLTIQQTPSPIRKEQVVDLIDPGQQKVVTFTQLGAVDVVQKTTVRVQVVPVSGETNTGNNTAAYPVIFTLSPPD